MEGSLPNSSSHNKPHSRATRSTEQREGGLIRQQAPEVRETTCFRHISLSKAVISRFPVRLQVTTNRKVQHTVPVRSSHGRYCLELQLLRKTSCHDAWVRPKRACKRASSLDPTLLGVFHFISFKVWLQTLFLLNFHLSRVEVGKKCQKGEKNIPIRSNPKENTSPGDSL